MRKFNAPPRELAFASPLPFTLTGETAPDPDRVERERLQKLAAARASAELQTAFPLFSEVTP